MSYHNHLGFNAPDFHEKEESATFTIRKCRPELAAYLKAQYGDKLPTDVEFWEKLPTKEDGRYWIDALSQKAIDDDPEVGDPVVEQYYITDIDTTEIIRQLGKLIDAKKQEISDRANGRTAGTMQGREDVAYLTGQMDGLRTAIKLVQGKDEFTVGESKNDVYRRTCERIYSLPWATNEESTMISIPKFTFKEWLRELDALTDGVDTSRKSQAVTATC